MGRLYREALVRICTERAQLFLQSNDANTKIIGEKFFQNMDTFFKKNGDLSGWDSMLNPQKDDYLDITTFSTQNVNRLSPTERHY